MRSNTAKIALLLAFYLAWVVLLRLEASGDLLDTVLTIIVLRPRVSLDT